MRSGRSFLILVLIGIGLGAYIYFIESERDPAGTIAPNEKVFAIEAGTIEEVQVTAESGEQTTARRDADGWRIVAPAALDADESAVSSLVSTIESLESERTVTEEATDLAQFNLAPPRMSIAFRVAGETNLTRLNIGARTPTGSDLYATIEGESRLLLIASYLEGSLNKTTFDLRNKSVLSFSRDGVDSMRLEPDGRRAVVLARDGSDWRLSAPVAAAADFSTVDGLVGRIFQAQMSSIITSDTAGGGTELTQAQLSEYGLDRPAVVATLGSGSTRAVLAVGGTHDDATRYARDLSRNLVFTLDNAVFDELTKSADDFRSKDLFAFRSFTAIGAELSLDGETRRYEEQHREGEDGAAATEVWVQVDPEPEAGVEIDQVKLTDLLTGLSNLRADAFVDRATTGGQEFVVVARFGDAAAPTVERIVFRKSGNTVQAIREGEPGAAVVPVADFDRALALFKEIAGLE